MNLNKEMVISRVYIYNGLQKAADQGVGYKVMLPDWKAREGEFQYEVGKTYSMEASGLRLCKSGFHYCEHAIDCLMHYDFVPENKFSQVKIHGKVIRASMGDLILQNKCATNIIEIHNEIGFEEWLQLCSVTVIILRNGRKYKEETYVKGILEKRLRYFVEPSKQGEDVVQFCTTRVPDRVPFRYNMKSYRIDQTLEGTCTWNEAKKENAYVHYDSKGIALSEQFSPNPWYE
jgi:hypothetical protein